MKRATKKTVRKNPVKKLTRYCVRVETQYGATGYLSDWSESEGPAFDTEAAKAIKSTDKKAIDALASATRAKVGRIIKTVKTVIVGVPVKKN